MRRYDVCGLGNALVDIEYHVDEDDLQALAIQKGVMTLVDESQQQSIVARLGARTCNRASGGSAANTIIAVSQLGGRAYYACRVADDDLGAAGDLVQEGVRRRHVHASKWARLVASKSFPMTGDRIDKRLVRRRPCRARLDPRQANAEIPVIAWPRISVWISSVPS